GKARVANRTAVVWTAARAPVRLSRRRSAGIRQPSVLLDGLGHLLGAGGPLVAGNRCRAVLLRAGHDLPVVVGPPELHGDGEPAAGDRVGGGFAREPQQAAAPD